MASQVLSASLATASSLGLNEPLLGIAGGLGIYFIALLLTWAIASATFTPWRQAFKSDEELLLLRLENFAGASLTLFMRVPSSLIDAFFSIASTIMNAWPRLLATVVIAGAFIVILDNDTTLTASMLRMRQCTLNPLLETFLYPLANLAQLLYSSVWPLVNVGVEALWFSSSGFFKIWRSCGSFESSFSSFFLVGDALSAFTSELSDFFGIGNFYTNRLSLLASLAVWGTFAGTFTERLDCVCLWLAPLWGFIPAVLQLTSLHLAIEYTVNAVIRVLQFALAFLTTLSIPYVSPIFDELEGLPLALATFAEDVLQLLFDLLFDLLAQIADMAEPYGARIGASMRASGSEAAWSPARGPVTLAHMRHAAMRTWASPLAHEGLKGSSVEDVRGATPIWALPPDTDLGDILGLPRLLQLLATPWAHTVGEPIAAALTLVNITLNAALHFDQVIANPGGLAFFQVKPVFDYLRAGWAAACSILVFFEDSLPCFSSLLGQAWLTAWEAVPELVMIVIYAIAAPTWLPNHAGAECIITPCTYPAPSGWTVFNVFPAYIAWEGNALRRALVLLQQDADCLALALGCDADTLQADNCSALPFQCALRTTYLATVEALNQTELFLFYLPDIVRFDSPGGFKTFQDLSAVKFFDLANTLIDCFVTWCALTLFIRYSKK